MNDPLDVSTDVRTGSPSCNPVRAYPAGGVTTETVYDPGGRAGNVYRPLLSVVVVSPPGTSAAVSGRARDVPANAVPLIWTGTPGNPTSPASRVTLWLRSR